jgi:perosamine synthetase
MKISLSEPNFFGDEIKYLKKCIKTKWISSSGKIVQEFEKKIKKYIRAKYVLGIINCTSALQLCVRLLEPNRNDEILVPSITFIASVNAVIYNNCSPVFMDCDENLLLDINKVIDFINHETYFSKNYSYNKKTKKKIIAIIVVHTFGNLVNLDKSFQEILKKKNIKIIEDSAESLGSYYNNGNHPGTIGYLGCLSFNGNKLITSGGGGMIIFQNKELYRKAIYLSAQAKNDPINFIHDEVGYNFRLSNLHAAIGCSQISKLNKVIKKKNKIHKIYKSKIDKIRGLEIMEKPTYCSSNYWLNILIIDEKKYGVSKKVIIKKFKQHKIESRPIWYPNHLQKSFKNFQNYKIKNTIKMHNSCICLPSSFNLTNNQQIKIINLLKNKFI